MRVDVEPFNDVRVRQALRLVIDRKQMVEKILSGYGSVANDLYGRFDEAYRRNLTRERDVAKARELLQQAGKPNLTIELVTGDIASGAVEAANLFAQQAKEAGITINVRKVDKFYGDDYLKYPFSQDFWFSRALIPQIAQGSYGEASPYNETHWGYSKGRTPSAGETAFLKKVAEARKTVDDGDRNKLLGEAQDIEFAEGGYIIWGFADQIDAYSTKVSGFVPDKTGIPLSSYGFRRLAIS
jgi:peptide/nickel transport system substrate-binding protein